MSARPINHPRLACTGILIVLLPVLLLLPGGQARVFHRAAPQKAVDTFSGSYAQEKYFLFSPDAKFLEMDSRNLKITGDGDLWHLNVLHVDRMIENTNGNDIFIVTKIWQFTGEQNPSRELFEARGVAVLQRASKGGLVLRTVIQPPSEEYSLSDGKAWKFGDAVLMLAWAHYTDTSAEYIVTTYDAQYREIRQYPGSFSLYDHSCFPSQTNIIYSPQNIEDILTLDLKTGTQGTIRFGTVGSPTYFSKTLVATDGCETLLVERNSRESEYSQIYLYNYLTKKIEGSFRYAALGDFYLLRQRELILIDESQSVIRTSGLNERHKLGRVHFVKFTGDNVGVVNVPKEGEIVFINDKASTAIYSAPGMISSITEHYIT